MKYIKSIILFGVILVLVGSMVVLVALNSKTAVKQGNATTTLETTSATSAIPLLEDNEIRRDKELLIPLKLYFVPLGDDSCERVESEIRYVPLTDTPAHQAVDLLLEGTKDSNLISVLPTDLSLNSIVIQEGLATVDFSDKLRKLAGSCTVGLARNQIESTLLQFSTVERVSIQIEGDSIDVLQP
jgi:spore germination protein GerM